MKKIVYFLAGVLLMITINATAKTFSFTDAKSGDWFYNDVQEVASWDVIRGNPDGSFKPGNNVNRAELSSMYVRYDNYLETKFATKEEMTALKNQLEELQSQSASETDEQNSNSNTSNSDSSTKNQFQVLNEYLNTDSNAVWYLNGEVKNNSTSEKGIDIEAVLYNSNNNILGTASTSIYSLKPGKTETFSISISVFDNLKNYDHYEIRISELW